MRVLWIPWSFVEKIMTVIVTLSNTEFSLNKLDLFWFPLAEVKCHKYDSEINIPHLVVTPDKYEYRYNERVSLRCEAGYTLQGPSTATCLEGFNLSSPLSCLGKIFIISNLAQLISEKMRYLKKNHICWTILSVSQNFTLGHLFSTFIKTTLFLWLQQTIVTRNGCTLITRICCSPLLILIEFGLEIALDFLVHKDIGFGVLFRLNACPRENLRDIFHHVKASIHFVVICLIFEQIRRG